MLAKNDLDFRVVIFKIDIKFKRSRGGVGKSRFGGNKQINLLEIKIEK